MLEIISQFSYNSNLNFNNISALFDTVQQRVSNCIKQSIIDFDNINGCRDISDEVNIILLKFSSRF